MTPKDLAARWRRDATTLEQYDPRLATVARQHAEQLEAALRDVSNETLDLASAAKESGYSADRLRHKVANGEIPNAGRKGAPRLRRGDLPSKRRASGGFDAAAVASQIVNRIDHA